MRTALLRPGDRPLLHLGLLAATLVTTTVAYRVNFGARGDESLGWLADALAFSVSLVAILGAHEMGHYLVARRHGVDTSLPYFIPLPILGFGTLGAVIRIRGRIPSKNALVDIGAAGPLAGLAVALPVLWYGLVHSKVSDAPIPRPTSFLGDGSLVGVLRSLFEGLAARLSGSYSPSPEPTRLSYLFGDNLLILGLQRLAKGPLPEGHDVIAHPMLIAGWFGLLVTMLNLCPIGQLDGGHLTHATLGRFAPHAGKAVALGLAALCLFYSAGWIIWSALTTILIGFRHPEVQSPELPLSRGRWLLCALSLAALVLCLMPVPLSVVTMP